MNSADLLVVGAGAGQIPAIMAAKAMGLRVVTVDRNGSAPGMALSDSALAVDVADIDGVVRVARDFNVRGAMTMQSDLPVAAVGAVNDALGLSGVSVEVAHRCSNKIAMREALASAGIPQPQFRRVHSLGDAVTACIEIGYPCVVKAPDSSGSRGVTRVDSSSQIEAAFHDAKAVARDAFVIIEEFITGIEFGAQTFSSKKMCVAVHVHDDEISEPPHMVPIAHSYPTTLPQTTVEHAREVISSAVDALGVADGPANVDAIVGADGLVRIIEVGARIGATCLPELTSYYTGTDWVEIAVLAALNEDVTMRQSDQRAVAAYILQAPNDGVLLDWSAPSEMLHDPRLLEWEVSAERGDEVSALRKGTDRIGKVVATGSDGFESLEFARLVRNSFVFAVRPG